MISISLYRCGCPNCCKILKRIFKNYGVSHR